jgi:DNA-binding HxlR family transcriptional regulator
LNSPEYAGVTAMKAQSMKPNAYAANCPTRQILDRVGDKWAVLILLLVRDEPMRFNQLRRAI